MANISEEVNIDILEKLADGTYKKKNPSTIAEQVVASDGSTLEEKWYMISSTEATRLENEVGLSVEVSNTNPSPADGKIYYNSVDKLFYVSRDGQWFRLYAGGDVKLDQEAPAAPTLKSKTDTTVTLNEIGGVEYRYQGGAWKESAYFTNLSRGETYKFEVRLPMDDVFKASPPSPALTVTTNKGVQSAPPAPAVTNIKHDRATVAGAANTEVRIDSGSWFDSPHTFTNLTEKTSYKAYARKKETGTYYASSPSVAKSFATPSDVPGPSELIGGIMQAGYFGEVPASELFTGTEIASAVGITQGTAQHNNEPWLKFAIDGKIIFKSKKPIRHSISYDHINSKGCVDGTKQVTKDGSTFKVRLMKGGNGNAGDASNGPKGSEWNKLMLPIHTNAPSSWAYPDNVNSPTQDWGVNFTDADLITHNNHGNGSYHWCQEVFYNNASRRVGRGSVGVSYSSDAASSGTGTYYGWSPVLELLP